MQIFNAEFYRYLALGFGAGAMLVLATIGIGGTQEQPGGMVTSAVAASAQ